MDVKSVQKNLGNQHFQMGQPPKKGKKKKKKEHTQSLKNPTWSSLERRKREALLQEEAGTTTLVAALPGPTQNKTRIKNIFTYTQRSSCGWVGGVHA
jgi:hypothetical protein